MSRDFRLQVFLWIIFSQAPEYAIRAVSNFFENSRRYLQLKVHHRCRWHWWKMKKNFNQKSFYYFFGIPLYSRINIKINLFLQVHFKMPAVWYFSHYLLPVLLTGINNTSGTDGKICHRCRWYRWCTFTCEYLLKFSNKFEMTLMLFSGSWGKMIHEKNLKQKSLDTVPLINSSKRNFYHLWHAGGYIEMSSIVHRPSVVQ